MNFAASTNVERFVIAPFVFALALPALVVARSGHDRHGIHRRRRPQLHSGGHGGLQ